MNKKDISNDNKLHDLIKQLFPLKPGDSWDSRAALTSIERLSYVNNLIDKGIWDWVIPDNTTYFSPRYYTMAGYEPFAFPCSFAEWEKRVHPADIGSCREAINNHLAGKTEKFEIEFRFKKKDGSWLWIKASGQIVERDAAGRPRRMVGTHTDIDESRRLQNALNEERQQLLSIFDSMEVIVYVADPDSYRILYANSTLLKIQPDLIGGLCYRQLQGRDEPCDFCTNHIILQNKYEPYRWEFYNKNFDKYFLLIDRIIKWPDGRDVRLEMGFDVTERKQQQEELKRKNEELERFTYTVSHDLKSPLVTMRGFAGMIQKDLSAGRHERISGDLERIMGAADKMEHLLNDLLNLSRIGRFVNPPTDIQMGLLVQEVLELLETTVEMKKAEIIVDENLPVVYGDRQRLKEVMQNLIENALKFACEQAVPRIEIGKAGERHLCRKDGHTNTNTGEYVAADTDVAGCCSGDNREVVFYVRDNGVGIEAPYLETIFNLFHKLDVKAPGTGIGLALVRRIIEHHNGRIWAESAGAGRGSTFYFTLPAGPETKKERDD